MPYIPNIIEPTNKAMIQASIQTDNSSSQFIKCNGLQKFLNVVITNIRRKFENKKLTLMFSKVPNV